jgi:DNA-binding beta-propeller fold protein YncE
MIVTADGARAYVAAPERDQVIVVDLDRLEIRATIELEEGDEPGRLVQDRTGNVHVALRSGGAVATIDGSQLVDRRDVCAAPRGIAYDRTTDQLHVACATGELVTMGLTGAPTRTLRLDRDLRDVIVAGDELYVSRFRAAELMRVDATGAVVDRKVPPTVPKITFDEFGGETPTFARPGVAYRAVGLRDGRTVMVHQRATQAALSTQPGGYGGGECFEGPVEVTVSIFDPEATEVGATRRISMASIPVDLAVSPDGDEVAIALAGSRTVRVVPITSLPMQEQDQDPCGFGAAGEVEIFGEQPWWGFPTSVAYKQDGDLVIQYDNAVVVRDPLGFTNDVVELEGTRHLDPGRRRFHEPTFAGLACASCHPEGRDDSMVWTFDSLGDRRTQNISGHLADRAPYHWGGDMHDLGMLFNEVLIGRMGGSPLTQEEADSLRAFLFDLPTLPAPTSLDEASVARGKALFDDPVLGCARCHSGALYTDNTMQDVGTGGEFKVPSLVGVGWRAPFIHTGCAPTLRDRFTEECGGRFHGSVDALDDTQMDDLIAFLESL